MTTLSFKYLLFSVLFYIAIRSVLPKRNLIIDISSCEHSDINPECCELNCSVTTDKRPNQITGYMKFYKPFPRFGTKIHISIKNHNRDKYETLLNQTFMDLCPLIRQNSRVGLVPLLFNEMLKFGNKLTCPLNPHEVYYYKDFKVNAEYFPLYVPEVEYQLLGSVHTFLDGKVVPAFKFHVTGKVFSDQSSFWSKRKTNNKKYPLLTHSST